MRQVLVPKTECHPTRLQSKAQTTTKARTHLFNQYLGQAYCLAWVKEAWDAATNFDYLAI